jgi:acyl-CoA thioesterase
LTGGLLADQGAAVGAFTEAVQVEPSGPGRYTAELSEVWTLRPLPQGGVITALALRAMADELDDAELSVRTLHTTFVGRVAHGPLEIDVEVLRRGRSMSHVRAEVRNPGAERGHVTIAALGRSREGFDFTDLAPPEVPPPEECPSFRDPPPPGFPAMPVMPFWDVLVEGRPAIGTPPWEDVPRTTSERACWYRFDDSPLLDDGTLDPLALVVMADTMPGSVGERVGPGDRPWFSPSVDLTVHLLQPCRSEWVLTHNRARFAGDGYASVEMALWDAPAEGPPALVAHATQVCLFTFPGPPT